MSIQEQQKARIEPQAEVKPVPTYDNLEQLLAEGSNGVGHGEWYIQYLGGPHEMPEYAEPAAGLKQDLAIKGLSSESDNPHYVNGEYEAWQMKEGFVHPLAVGFLLVPEGGHFSIDAEGHGKVRFNVPGVYALRSQREGLLNVQGVQTRNID